VNTKPYPQWGLTYGTSRHRCPSPRIHPHPNTRPSNEAVARQQSAHCAAIRNSSRLLVVQRKWWEKRRATTIQALWPNH